MISKLKYIAAVVILMTSCKKQLDINTDPNNPVTLAESKLLPAVEENLGNSFSIGNGTVGGLSNDLETYVHRINVREDPDQYGATGDDFYISTNWLTFYITVVTNANAIISEGTTNGNMKYVGIAEILKAYGFSQMVDAYGDIPYSETGKLITGAVRNPHFDKGSAIYPQLIALLDKGIADVGSTTNTVSPGTDDVIYHGAVANWIKAANTIKLKLFAQQRLTSATAGASITALIAGGNLIAQTSDSFLLPYGPNGATDDRNPGFGDYYASQRTDYISPWFHEILTGQNARIYTGITDPRVPYYYFNQILAGTQPQNPTEYRDGAFLSIYFGSLGQNAAQNQQNYLTVLGIYPVGGRYDDGLGPLAGVTKGVSAADGTGAAPYRFVTYADLLYLEAELMQVGTIPGNARATFSAAMTESFKQIDYVITKFVKPSQAVPVITGTTAQTAYVASILTDYDNAATTNAAPDLSKTYTAVTFPPHTQLESIMTQKWISSFGSAVDAYTDYRRTGFPVMWDPNDPAMAPNHIAQPPVNADVSQPGGAKPIPVQLLRPYPRSLPWYSQELSTNLNAPAQKIPSAYKVFWDPGAFALNH